MLFKKKEKVEYVQYGQCPGFTIWHSFSLQKNDDNYWKKWFWDLRELRKNKLKKIESRG
jgi:hypothetical protein